ncbi:hypothetical protein, partial [Alicyclobacillus suci]|uniref:hypothetical protein n=1 Tax=Alicyclobacillus suci TaxID=2816080 RepID=UPI001A8F9E23
DHDRRIGNMQFHSMPIFIQNGCLKRKRFTLTQFFQDPILFWPIHNGRKLTELPVQELTYIMSLS